MIYRAIGIMSGSSLDGLDIAFVEFSETGGKWAYQIIAADCIEYSTEWQQKLSTAINLSALNYQLLHIEYGHYIGKQVNAFIDKHHLHHKVNLIASHGHTTFHMPQKQMTAQLGDGAAIAAETNICVVSDLRNLDVALGGQGAPIVTIGEKLLFANYSYFLNIGGIANVSINTNSNYIAYDVCPANRVMNMLVNEIGIDYDAEGKIAASGKINAALLNELNALEYYKQPFPKSLANSFGIEVVYPLIKKFNLSTNDALRTFVEHICTQVFNSINIDQLSIINYQLLITGGGAFNSFLIECLQTLLKQKNIEVIVPDENTVKYKEAIIMALIGVLRWREEENVLSSATGASKSSIGGALWMG